MKQVKINVTLQIKLIFHYWSVWLEFAPDPEEVGPD